MAEIQRRSLLAGVLALGAGACSKIAASDTGQSLFQTAEDGHRAVHRVLAGKQGLAPEYTSAERSPTFKGNGSVTVEDAFYQEQLAKGFPEWRLMVGGLVEQPLALSLADVRALPQRTQITRHDCVEGWSAIGEWTGPQLSALRLFHRVLGDPSLRGVPEARELLLLAARVTRGLFARMVPPKPAQ
jgi:DMSO/TMAO reductase YedYZ molybdopterin-dependent catalytic subunit